METVAGAPDGLDAFIGMTGGIFQLVTQTVDMDGDRCGFTDGIEAPDLFKELLFGKDFIRMLHEEEEYSPCVFMESIEGKHLLFIYKAGDLK